jgi:hypothetical protein
VGDALSLLKRRAAQEDAGGEIPADLREAYEERAAFLEYEGGLPREEAERRAWEAVRGLPPAGKTAGKTAEAYGPGDPLKVACRPGERKSGEYVSGKRGTKGAIP